MQPIQQIQLYSRPGSTVNIRTDLSNIRVGSTLVCTAAVRSFSEGQEFRVDEIKPTTMKLSRRGSARIVPVPVILCGFKVRAGTVLPGSITRGLTAQAIRDGERYKRGNVITLVECGGRVYDYRDENKKKGAVTHDELISAFVYM